METKRLTLRLDAQDCADLDTKRGSMSRNEAICEAIKIWNNSSGTDNQTEELALSQQINVKDKQIEELHRMLEQQQTLLGQAHALALGNQLPATSKPDKPKGFFARIKWVFTD